MKSSQIPQNLLDGLGEHTSSFILFYFDGDGTPAFYRNFPEVKDAMAMQELLSSYVHSDGDMFSSEDDDGEGDEEKSEKD